MNDTEIKILVPKRLIENLIHCIKLQKSVEKSIALETQSLVDSTIYWANSFLKSEGINQNMSITLDEALEFVKIQRTGLTETCDFIESAECREVVVEPDYPK